MKLTNVRTLSAMMGLSLLAGMSNPALAGTDSKNYTGSACETLNASDRSAFELMRGGKIRSQVARFVNFKCPVAKDIGGGASAEVFVVDETPNRDAFCELLSLRSSGAIAGRSTATSKGVNPGVQKLTLGRINGADFYSLECSLPPTPTFPNGNIDFERGAEILMYRIIERE